jgi:hypothetical protein
MDFMGIKNAEFLKYKLILSGKILIKSYSGITDFLCAQCPHEIIYSGIIFLENFSYF